ncbi:ABC transporter permease [Massilibacteroides sp.]|uniref:ABC transporter permease n=1 Tax=Massilibacteroides sp. TaxID=2034766 RepID=UPI00262F9FED|nr:ABC transporter permease [Massilibacteroides sp.]MDD4516077.1 ABC transporter permease [Massilibacteroides sp.]
MKQFQSFLKKEFYHIFRDSRTTITMMVIPIVLVILFGYAITTEIKSTRFVVFDQSKNSTTQRIIDRLAASEYFVIYKQVSSYEEIETLFRKNKIRMAIVFPPDFEENRQTGTEVQLLTDASDPNEATSLVEYATTIINTELTKDYIVSSVGIKPVVRLLYNPQMKDAYNFVPGVMGMILILICSIMTSVGIVREKEYGSMEVLLVSPLKPVYIILAKATPYLLISLVNILTILSLAYFLLDVPIKGSLFLVIMLSLLYALLALTLGLFVSTIAKTQQAAMLICGIALMLPIILLSGMMFPVENMPWILQQLSNLIPARWYIVALRDVMIKGLGVTEILPEISILVVMTLVLIVLSVKRFKVRLE